MTEKQKRHDSFCAVCVCVRQHAVYQMLINSGQISA